MSAILHRLIAFTTKAAIWRAGAIAFAGMTLGASGGCGVWQTVSGPGGAYVAADRATHDAIAPEYAAYVAADPNLDPIQKDRRLNTVATWRMRVERAEAGMR